MVIDLEDIFAAQGLAPNFHFVLVSSVSHKPTLVSTSSEAGRGRGANMIQVILLLLDWEVRHLASCQKHGVGSDYYVSSGMQQHHSPEFTECQRSVVFVHYHNVAYVNR